MNTDDITKNVLDTIEEQNIEPKPRWQFLLKDSLVWFLGGVAFIVGSFAMATIIFVIENSDWDIRRYTGFSFKDHFMATAPFIWALILIVFVSIAYYNFKHTKKGYRYRFVVAIAVTVILSAVSGVALHAAGLGEKVENTVGQRMPGYSHVIDKRMVIWANPDRGLLIGKVLRYNSNNELLLEDFNGLRWVVLTNKLEEHHKIVFKNVDMIGLIGKKVDDDVFEACAVRPWIRGERSRGIDKHGKEIPTYRPIRTKERADHLVKVREKLDAQGIDQKRIFESRIKGCEERLRQ